MPTWLRDGAPALPRRAGLSRPCPGAASPAGARPASGELRAGRPDPGSTAGSIAGGRTGVHTLCASTTVPEGVGLWHDSGSLVYRGECPRECTSPKGSPGRMLRTFSPGVDENGNQTDSLRRPWDGEQDAEGNTFTRALRRKPQRRTQRKDNQGRKRTKEHHTGPPDGSRHLIETGAVFPIGPIPAATRSWVLASRGSARPDRPNSSPSAAGSESPRIGSGAQVSFTCCRRERLGTCG
jgi:hypothetical protein